MADEEVTTSDQEATTEIPEQQEPESPEQQDEEDGLIFDFRSIADKQAPMPKEESGEAKGDTGEKPKEPATSTGGTVKAPVKAAEAEPELKGKLSALEQSNANLQSQIANLNAALHQERQAKKTDKEEEPLTQSQLAELFKLHADDPVELMKLVQYTAAQAAKRGKEDTINAVQVAEQKKQADTMLVQKWPILKDPVEGPKVRANIEQAKRQLMIESHPYADYLSVAYMVHEKLPEMLKGEYERGKAEALSTVAETGRKQSVKETGLERGDKGGKVGDGGTEFKQKHLDVIKILNMNPGQVKTYEKMMKAKGAKMIEASR